MRPAWEHRVAEAAQPGADGGARRAGSRFGFLGIFALRRSPLAGNSVKFATLFNQPQSSRSINRALRRRPFVSILIVNVTSGCPCGTIEGPMQRPDERELREHLVRLRAEHRELDREIVAEEASPLCDQLQIKRLKKRKLALKDQITAIEDQLLPDIIA